MLTRLKRALVDSYVGAIGLCFLLADVVLHFCYIFAAPVASWVSRTEYRKMLPSTTVPQGFMLADALPELTRFILLFVAWAVLMRWLYFTSTGSTPPGSEARTE